VLGQAFVSMSGYLSNLASAAGKIAEGNLGLSIQPQSQQDVLGRSFIQMQDNLRSMVEEIINSARGFSLESQNFLETTQKAGDSVFQITSSIEQVAQNTNDQTRAIESIAHGAEDQLASTTTASRTSEQMSQAIQEVTKNAQSGILRANNASEAVRAGAQKVQEVIIEMGRIQEKVGATAAAVSGMNTRSDQIQEIAETIDDFSSQTNLLALNAAIEAARAGEHGRGFAVVADEVRKLAERVSNSTREIKEVVSALRQSIRDAGDSMDQGSAEVVNGVMRAGEAGQALELIHESISGVVQQADGISSAANGILVMSREMLDSMNSVSRVSEENSTATRKMAANSAQVGEAAETVTHAAEDMSGRVQELVLSAKALTEMAQDLQISTVKFKL
jgi:methyl-accepting chemotaxis protein